MPELPEVETIAADLRNRIAGFTIARAVLARSDYLRTPVPRFTDKLAGRTLLSIGRQGKRILVDLDDRARLILHLGMSGRITVAGRSEPVAPHTHFTLQFKNDNHELRMADARRFGGIWFIDSAAESPNLGKLGPDALTIDAPSLAEICRRNRQIKALLMDQTIICGLGNIYCDEALFAARIHPLQIAGDLSTKDVKTLAREIRRTLEKALQWGGSTLRDYVRADGRTGEFQKIHRVYGRQGEPCTRCGDPIERFIAAGRSTHVCARCQSRGVNTITRSTKPSRRGR